VGVAVGLSDTGELVGILVGTLVGALVGDLVGALVGALDGALAGFLVLNILPDGLLVSCCAGLLVGSTSFTGLILLGSLLDDDGDFVTSISVGAVVNNGFITTLPPVGFNDGTCSVVGAGLAVGVRRTLSIVGLVVGKFLVTEAGLLVGERRMLSIVGLFDGE
jgi:hypothetical protein